jgi:hypothetical protein
MPERDFGDQLLEARAAPVLARLAEVGVDDADAIGGPARMPARSTSAYWLTWLSRWCCTCRAVDWRT